MSAVQVFKSILGDWVVMCDECGALVRCEQWLDAQDKATKHALGHEINRCSHCGRS